MIRQEQIVDAPKVLTSSTKPTTGPGKGAWFTKIVSGIAEGFYVDSEGTEIQITSNGTVLGGGGGEANTASNLGTSGDGSAIFSEKVGVDLRFRRIKAGTNITVTEETNNILISASGGGSGEANTASNLGTGSGVFAQKSGVDLQFKSLKAGTNVTLTPSSTEILISASGAGEANTASNLGSIGEGIFAQKSGVDLQFKKLVAGTNVTLSASAESITINATGGGSGEANTASNLGTGIGTFAQKSGVDLQFKSLKAGANTTITQTATEITISSTGGGSAAAPTLIHERYQVVAASGEEAFLTTFDPYGKTGLSWTRSGTTMTITSTGHGLSNGDMVIVRNTNVATQQVLTVSNASTDTFDVTVSDTGGTSGTDGIYQRGASLSRAGSTMTLSGPSNIMFLSGSFRIPSSVTSPLIFDYAVVGLNTSPADRYPPQIYQWREDTGAAVIPGTSSANLVSSNYGQLSITMPSANRLFKFVF